MRRAVDLKGLLKRRRAALIALLALCASLCACGAPGARESSDPKAGDAARILLDGAAWDGSPVSPQAQGLRVYVTLDGAPLVDVPFGEAREITVVQPDGGENVIAITGGAVYMRSANCENQDCVQMGEVTEENLELRVLGGFIVCLPHRLSVEVR